MAATIAPNAHEKAEWSRLAQRAYMAGDSATGHRFSAAACLPMGATLPLATFDALQSDYRAWLLDGATRA